MSRNSKKKGKHTYNNSTNHKHYIVGLIIFFCFILILFIYNFSSNILKMFGNKNQSESLSEISTDLDDTQYVKGLDFIKVKKINIKTSSAESSIIEIIFENTTNEDSVETSAHFYALDSNGDTIFGMPLTIPSISANSSSNYKILCTNNLSNVKDYIVSVQQ